MAEGGGDHAQGDGACFRRGIRGERCRERRPTGGPRVDEGAAHVRHGRPLQGHSGVAPGRDATVRIALPGLAHTKPGDEGHAVVHDQALPVVAAQPAEGLDDLRRVVTAHLDAGLPKASPESRRRLAEAPHPVVEHPHRHALARLGGEGGREPLAHRVFREDVHLEVDEDLRLGDGFEPGGVVFGGVSEESHRVAGHEGRSGRPRKRLLGEEPELGAHVPQYRWGRDLVVT